MGGHEAVEVAKTVLEVADVAWTAMECSHHLHHHHDAAHNLHNSELQKELETLKSENRRLRNQLERNLKLLNNLSESPVLLNDCPPDLYARLVSTVDSRDFLTRLKSLNESNTKIEFPFKEATGDDIHSAEVLINVDQKDPSWWVWVTDEMVPSNVEEWSGIDDENYIVVSEEHVVDGVANFMAKCILSNPKAQTLTPEELQKNTSKVVFCFTSMLPDILKFADEFQQIALISIEFHLLTMMRFISSYAESIRRCRQIGEGFEHLACWKDVLYIVNLGTYTGWIGTRQIFSGATRFRVENLNTYFCDLDRLYKSRTIVKLAAMGIHTTGKVVMRVL
uniref:Uncharacterized protein n=1 Tax=Gossypioides kirkii TaxID=47615 RepID=B2ZAQ3_9ROSI|nr:unknown predicted protein [Gossypioides kirkii]